MPRRRSTAPRGRTCSSRTTPTAQAIGLGLDLSLRDRTNGKVTRDDYMRALWTQFGRPGQKEPGKVAHAYTIDGLKESLAKVCRRSRVSPTTSSRSSSKAARWSTTRALLARAGLVMRKRAAGQSVCRPGARCTPAAARCASRPGAVGIAALQGRRRAGRSAGQPRWHRVDVDGELRRSAGDGTSPATACRCGSSAAAARR